MSLVSLAVHMAVLGSLVIVFSEKNIEKNIIEPSSFNETQAVYVILEIIIVAHYLLLFFHLNLRVCLM